MASIILRLSERGLIKPPSYAKDLQYEVITRSIAYGTSSDVSDCDIVGFCIPSKEVVFPHLVEDHPKVAQQLRKAFPDVFPEQGKFILHTGSGRHYDPTNIELLYFLGEGKEHMDSRHIVKLDGTWSDLTECEYPDQHNMLFTGTLKVEDGVLVEVNVG